MEAIIEQSSKTELIKSFSTLSLEKIVKEKMPSIGLLAKVHGEEVIENAVGVLISDLNESFDKNLSRNEIEEIIAEVTSGFSRNLTLEGIYLTCREIKYKNDTIKITVNKVLKALANHQNSLMECAMRINYSNHLSHKHQGNRSNNDALEKQANQIAKTMYITGKLK